MKRLAPSVAAALALAAIPSPTFSTAAAPSPDPGALAAVNRYVAALKKPDPERAFRELTPAQQRYFGNARNFASNYATTHYRIVSASVARIIVRNPALVQVDMAQRVTFYDIAGATSANAAVVEPYFALRDGGTWGVKELFAPWKSYAPRATGRSGGLTVIVDRIEFFDKRVQVDCTLRNFGTKPLQVLPLLKSTLTLTPSAKPMSAMNSASFPLNDQQFYQGARVYPSHQLVGFINFALPSKVDADMTALLVVAPAIEDGSNAPSSVRVGPMDLPRW